MTADINNSQDILDIRDIIARVEELESERDTLQDELNDADNALDEAKQGNNDVATDEARIAQETATTAMAVWSESDDAAELKTLETLLNDLRGNGGDEDWEGDWYPAMLIRDSHFEESMDEMLEDCGDIPKNLPAYLKITVDYDALKMDYSSVEFDDVTYWYR